MIGISEIEIIKRLELDNPWWKSNQIDDFYSEMAERAYFASFGLMVQDISTPRAIILMGPRRVGKTVMVQQAIRMLIQKNVPAKNILYVSIDNPLYTHLRLEKLLNFFIKKNKLSKNQRAYVFFDEIQYLKNWEQHLKSLVDTYKKIKFIATGSAAAALRLKSRESGAGRFTDFMLPPLTFSEYIRFIGREKELIIFPKVGSDDFFETPKIEELNAEYINYLNFGGYPEPVFNETIRKDIAHFIKNDIIDKVLLRDLPSLYGIDDIQELNRLFTVIAYNTAEEVSLESLSKTSGLHKNTIKKYLEYLDAAFLIRRVFRISENAKRFKRANFFKVYLTNPSMRAALFGSVEDADAKMGALAETGVLSQWLHSNESSVHYARWKKGEVDIVSLSPGAQKPNWTVEIKWSDRPLAHHELLNNSLKFNTDNNIKVRPLVTTKTKSGLIEYKKMQFKAVPTALYAYTVGYNTVKTKHEIARKK